MSLKDAAVYWDISLKALRYRVHRLMITQQSDYASLCAEYAYVPPAERERWDTAMRRRARAARVRYPTLHPGWVERWVEGVQTM